MFAFKPILKVFKPVVYKAVAKAVDFLDWLTIKESDWKYVHESSEAIFQKELVRHGVHFFAEIMLDFETIGARYGVFGVHPRPGCVPSQHALFFYPARDEAALATEMIASGMTERRAKANARALIEDDHELAVTHGVDWFLYAVRVTASTIGTNQKVVAVRRGVAGVMSLADREPAIDEAVDQIMDEAAKQLAEIKISPPYGREYPYPL